MVLEGRLLSDRTRTSEDQQSQTEHSQQVVASHTIVPLLNGFLIIGFLQYVLKIPCVANADKGDVALGIFIKSENGLVLFD